MATEPEDLSQPLFPVPVRPDPETASPPSALRETLALVREQLQLAPTAPRSPSPARTAARPPVRIAKMAPTPQPPVDPEAEFDAAVDLDETYTEREIPKGVAAWPYAKRPPEPLPDQQSLDGLAEEGRKKIAAPKPLNLRPELMLPVFFALIVWLFMAGATDRGWLPQFSWRPVVVVSAPVIKVLGGREFKDRLKHDLQTGEGVFAPRPGVFPALGAGLAFVLAAAVLIMLRLPPGQRISVRMLGMSFDRNTACRGWFITGDTGSGKTAAGIMWLLHQFMQRESGVRQRDGDWKVPPWGGLFCDEKGMFYHRLVEVCATYGRSKDLGLLQTKPEWAKEDWEPQARYNLVGDDRIPAKSYAKLLVETAQATEGKEDSGSGVFFKTQAQLHMAWGLQLLTVARRLQVLQGWKGATCVPTLSRLYRLLSASDFYRQMVVQFGICANSTDETTKADAQMSQVLKDGPLLVNSELPSALRARLRECVEHFNRRFWNMPKDTLGSVQGNITNYLDPFTEEEIAEVFCCDQETFDFKCIDRGGLICVSMPQKHRLVRRYITTILKYLFYNHALRRFDMDLASFAKKNLLLLWQDEAQRFAIEEDGNVDVLRESGCTTIMATQMHGSLYGPLGGEKKADAIIGNLRNLVIFGSADEDCARKSATKIGKVMGIEKSWSTGRSGRGYNYSKKEKFKIEPLVLMDLPPFVAVVRHADKKWRKAVVPVVEPNGRLSVSFLHRIATKFPFTALRYGLQEIWYRLLSALTRRNYSFTGAVIPAQPSAADENPGTKQPAAAFAS